MEIACPHCGLLRKASDAPGARTSELPCPRCLERARLLGGAPELALSDAESAQRRGEWHVILRGLQRGPYTLTALRRLLAQADEGGTAVVWRAGLLDWLPARELALFRHDAEPVADGSGAEPRASASSRSSASPLRTSRVPTLQGLAPPVVREVGGLSGIAPAPEAAPAQVPGALAATTLWPEPPASRRPRGRAAGEVTLEIPAFRAGHSAAAAWLRWLALGTALSVAALALFVSLRRAHGPVPGLPVVARAAPPPARSPVPSAPVPSAPSPPAPSLPVPSVAAALAADAAPRQAPAAFDPRPRSPSAPATAEASAAFQLRVGSSWAPIRDTTLARAQVVCSLPRGTLLTALAQRPGKTGRWFEVRCDAHRRGWVHENHLASVAARAAP